MFDVGVNLSDDAQIRVGYLYTRRSASVETGSTILPEDERDDAGLTLTATYDTRDTPFNPTRGVAAALEYAYVDDSLGGDLDWERLELGVGLAVPGSQRRRLDDAGGRHRPEQFNPA